MSTRDEPVAFKPRPLRYLPSQSLRQWAAAFLRNSLIIGVARNGLQDKAQRFGPALKVSEDAAAILLLILVGTWIPVAHAMPECVVE